MGDPRSRADLLGLAREEEAGRRWLCAETPRRGVGRGRAGGDGVVVVILRRHCANNTAGHPCSGPCGAVRGVVAEVEEWRSGVDAVGCLPPLAE